MTAIKTATILEYYEFKLTEAQVRLVGVALQKLPMETVYTTVMEIERQVQEQNFKLQQTEVQNKVTDANKEIALIADANAAGINRAAADPSSEPPTVTFLPDPLPDVVSPSAAEAEARLGTPMLPPAEAAD